MNASSLTRLFPAASRLASRRATASPSLTFPRPQSCQWVAGTRRSFSARPSLYVKKYTEDHEWIEIDTDGVTGTIGVTEYAAKALGEVVYVELPELGMEVTKGDTIGAVESVKSASDILSPVSGKVTEHNKLLEEKPGSINKSPESDAWIAKVEITNASELDSLMSKEDYDTYEKE